MRRAITVVITFIFLLSLVFSNAETEDAVPILFSVNLLSPNTSPVPNDWIVTIDHQLPEIGIDISHHDSSSWSIITPRTWYYPVGEPGYYDYIPTYEEGGFDIFFCGRIWSLDWDPRGVFDTAGLPPNGDNIYQFSNSTYDSILEQYTSELDYDKRFELCKLLQSILYEELPSIVVMYEREIINTRVDITGIDYELLASNQYLSEFWNDTDDQAITIATPFEIDEYNVFTQRFHIGDLWMHNVYRGLFQRAQYSHFFEPSIASYYNISDDGKQYNVTIDPNAKFSNSEQVLAEDVKYSYELYMADNLNLKSGTFLKNFFEDNDSIIILDDNTIQFSFREKHFRSLEAMSYGIIDKSIVEPLIDLYGVSIIYNPPFTEDVGEKLVTACGPFMLATFDEQRNNLTMIPNPYWHKKQPELKQITIKFIPNLESAIAAINGGIIDVMDYDYRPYNNQGDYNSYVQSVITKIPAIHEVIINLKHPILGTGELTPNGTAEAAKYIRKAISHAIPREEITEGYARGINAPGVTPMPNACVGYDDTLEYYKYDLELAREYMEKAGYNYTLTASSNTFSILMLSLIGLASLSYFYKKK